MRQRDGSFVFWTKEPPCLTLLYREDAAAGDPAAAVSGGLAAVVIRAAVQDDGAVHDLAGPEASGVIERVDAPAAGEHDGQISGVVRVGALGGVIVSSGAVEGEVSSGAAVAQVVDVHGKEAVPGQSGQPDQQKGTRLIGIKQNFALEIWIGAVSLDQGLSGWSALQQDAGKAAGVIGHEKNASYRRILCAVSVLCDVFRRLGISIDLQFRQIKTGRKPHKIRPLWEMLHPKRGRVFLEIKRKAWGRRAKALAGSFLAGAFAVTAGFAVQGHVRAGRYRRLLDNGYQHAFAELSTAVSELDAALQKGRYAVSPALLSTLCTQIYGKAMSAQMAIGELPYGNVELEQTASFLAKAGDYAMYLSRAAVSDGGCPEEHRPALQALSDAASTLNAALQSLQSDLDAGTADLEDIEAAQQRLSRTVEDGRAVLSGSAYQTVESDFPEVPSLIYDGPFSDHIASLAPKMLEGEPSVTRDEARAAAAAFLGLRPEIFRPSGDGTGRIPVWGFSAVVDGGELYVSVTKAGGHILEVLSARTASAPALSRVEGAAAAARFLEEHGYPHMKETYSVEQGNVLTVNFAAAQGDVLCYPDLIKVSIALDTGRISGFEAEGYLMNHTERALDPPSVSMAKAQTLVGPGLHILSHQLALIPTGGSYEVLCHEFKCKNEEGQHYLLYLNAQTGQEEKILILLEDESGTLAL